ncbi:gamma-glutamyltransferase [Bordetella genomosp. 1]|uniref:Gamma-glutamyltransferase n=2 Tax=Bordetella genomosp. 1 TaxID=1395607 RepID=A0A261SIC3_9BORD|nr:gamma-glutamyltransferase [Bordetella genomosp. 1]
MICAAQPEAAEAGARVLRDGGNAVDAAVAAAFTQCVVDPLMAGIAGYGTLQIALPGRGVHTCIDFCARAPAAAHPGIWAGLPLNETPDGYAFVVEGNVNEAGYQSIGTPGTLAGLDHALARYGTWSFADALAPALAHAREGVVVRPHMYQYGALDRARGGMLETNARLALSATGRKVYLGADGQFKRPGERLHNPDLTATLGHLARAGAADFYHGEIAARIAEDMQAHGGLLCAADLRDYRVSEMAPIWGEYRGWRVAGFPPPAGGLTLIQALHVLGRFDVAALGHNSAAYLALLAQTLKWITIDKDTLIGDPEFVDVPVEHLLSRAHAEDIAGRIRAQTAADVARLAPGIGAEPRDTTQVCVIDADGNAATLTHSLGTSSGVITDGLGFLYNGLLSGFDPRPGRAASIGPGKRRTSSQCPLLLWRDGEVQAALGAPGGTAIPSALTQTVVNLVDFGMSPFEAVAAPRISVTGNAIDVSNRIPRYVTDALAAQGQSIQRSYQSYAFAAPHLVSRMHGVLQGGADPQRDGVALRVGQPG